MLQVLGKISYFARDRSPRPSAMAGQRVAASAEEAVVFPGEWQLLDHHLAAVADLLAWRRTQADTGCRAPGGAGGYLVNVLIIDAFNRATFDNSSIAGSISTLLQRPGRCKT